MFRLRSRSAGQECYSSGKTGTRWGPVGPNKFTIRQPGLRSRTAGQVLIPEGWRERISTSLPANARSDPPRDHPARKKKEKKRDKEVDENVADIVKIVGLKVSNMT